jgi:hypothetical protein
VCHKLAAADRAAGREGEVWQAGRSACLLSTDLWKFVVLSGAWAVYSQASAAATSAWVPVSRVGWMTGAKFGEWLTGMSCCTRLACSAAR